MRAVVNVGLGTYIFNDGVSDIFLVYVGYISFIVILFGVMFFVFSITTTFIKDAGILRNGRVNNLL